jgi:hypothetical protein
LRPYYNKRVTAADIRSRLRDYIKESFINGKMSWEEAEENLGLEKEFPDEMAEESLWEAVRKLDDKRPVLGPLVMKLLGEVKNP